MTSDLESRIPDPFIFDDATPSDLPPADLTENARIVLSRRYLKKDETGKPTEEPETMFWRVARVIAEADRHYGASDAAIEEVARHFYELMTTGKFEPNSPTLMNAGRSLGQLSACFVLPVDDALSNGKSGIYDTLKSMALVHQSGGGCVAGDAHVHTTFCGVEAISTLYERVRALGIEEIVHEDHRIMDVAHLDIRTLAHDAATGAFEPRAVTHLWKWDVPADQQFTVSCADGSVVTTSAWHPFMVFSSEGAVERRADALQRGDILITPNRSIWDRWPFTDPKVIEGLVIDEPLAWLVGYTLGSGFLDVVTNHAVESRTLRLKLYDERPQAVRFAAQVLSDKGVRVSPKQDAPGHWSLTASDTAFLPIFARVAEMAPGGETDLTLPEWVGKSPLSVVGAFLGGLVDADCEVDLERQRVVLPTASPRLARRLVSLLSTLGFAPSLREKAPRTGMHQYRVKLADTRKNAALVELIGEWVHDPFRRERLETLRSRNEHSTQRRLPLAFEVVADLLEEAGLDTTGTALHRTPVMVGGEPFWLNRLKWGQGIGEDKLKRLVCALRRVLPEERRDRLDRLARLADGWAVVDAVGRASEPKPFFDFTVEGLNTYLAGGGEGKMLVIHNTGFSFSRLRPEGDFVRSTSGVASGPVSFMRLYDGSTEVVKQGGTRRGANMGILRVDHPDIRKFITCKDDTSQITNFNISVAITDAFMDAVKKGEKYDLINPRTKKVFGQEDAREIFSLIVHGAWKTGEPGTFFIDRANEYNPVPKLMTYEATNPCVVGSTRMVTDRGILTMEELWERRMEIAVATDNRVPHARAVAWAQENGGTAVRTRVRPGITTFPAVPVFKTREDAPVFRLRTTHGHEIVATDNHKFFTPKGPVELAELKPGDALLIQSGEGPWSKERTLPPFQPTNKLAARIARGEANLPREWSQDLGQVLGWIVADGWVTKQMLPGLNVPRSIVGLLFGNAELELEPIFRGRIQRWIGQAGTRSERPGRVQLLFTSGFHYFLESLGVVTEDGKTNRVPKALWSAPREAVVGFLQGLFTADGTVNISSRAHTCTVRLSSSDPELLREVQVLLQNFGIVGRIKLRRPAGRKSMPDGHGGMKEYNYRAQYELIIDKANRDRFLREVGFLTAAKQRKAELWVAGMSKRSGREHFVTRVESIEAAGREDVYCTTEFHTHSIVVSALVTAQCGEQPLGAYDVCNLGSVNLAPFVKPDYRPGTADPLTGIDWDALRQVVHLSTHFLDNVIDANRYPLDEIHRLAQTIRRIGLGVMGWADMLVRLGVPYDTAEGVELGRKVMEFVDEESRNASEKLAESRGVFPAWEESIWGPDATCARRADGARVRAMRRLRNCNLTTVAPTGTISIFAGCASGIEPLFAVAFMRNQAGAMMPDVNPDFVRVAKQQDWYSDELIERIAKEGHIHFPEVPESVQRVFVTAHDIVPEWHVRMQAAFQKHVDSAISKTTNFSFEATEKDVREIYELAYDLGCKGVTVYRDGCRPMQVLSTGKTGKGEQKPEDTSRAIELSARVADLEHSLADAREDNHRMRVQISEIERERQDEDQTRAAGRHKRQRPTMLRGRTVKMNSPLGDLYVTINEDEQGRPFEVFCTLGKAGGAAMADAEAIGRLVSLALRSGIAITAVRDQLRGISCDRAVGLGPNKVLSAPDAIGQAIERYLEEKEGVQEALPLDTRTVAGARVQTQSQSAARADDDNFLGTCPDCGTGHLAYLEGCVKCHICGYSECG